MKVLITGGAGFIGSHLADALLERGDRVAVADDLSTGQLGHVDPRVELHRLDIRAAEAGELVRRWRPDAICHHAAQISVSRSVREPLLDADVNLHGSLRLLEAAREVGARFVFASSGGAIYGDAAPLPTPETWPPRPASPYAVAKLAFEHYLRCYHAQHGLGYVALRYSNVYGPRQNPHGEAGVIAVFCRRLLSEEEVVINGDGRATRDFVYVGDVVRANLAALDSEVVGHFNVGTGRPIDVNRLFELVAAGLGVEREKVHGPPRAGDVRASALDCTLIARELGWRPQVTLEEGLGHTIEWFRQQTASAVGSGVDG